MNKKNKIIEVIGAFKYIKIGNNVRCGANTLITDSDWHYNYPHLLILNKLVLKLGI